MQNSNRPQQGYPLGLLFILVAFAAVLMAMFSTLFRDRSISHIGSSQVAATLVAGGAFGMSVGLLLGLHHYWRGRGAAWGCLTGVLVGSVSLPLMLIPEERMVTTLIAGVGGAIFLLVVGASMRGYSKRRNESEVVSTGSEEKTEGGNPFRHRE